MYKFTRIDHNNPANAPRLVQRVNARQFASDYIELVLQNQLDDFEDELDQKLVLDAVERHIAKLRVERKL